MSRKEDEHIAELETRVERNEWISTELFKAVISLLDKNRKLADHNKAMLDCLEGTVKMHKKCYDKKIRKKESDCIFSLVSIVDIEDVIEKIKGKPINEVVE